MTIEESVADIQHVVDQVRSKVTSNSEALDSLGHDIRQLREKIQDNQNAISANQTAIEAVQERLNESGPVPGVDAEAVTALIHQEQLKSLRWTIGTTITGLVALGGFLSWLLTTVPG